MIVFEAGDYHVIQVNKTTWQAMINAGTHSIADSAYADVSLAIARVEYLHKTNTAEVLRKRIEAARRRGSYY